jgi:hypothetical protein
MDCRACLLLYYPPCSPALLTGHCSRATQATAAQPASAATLSPLDGHMPGCGSEFAQFIALALDTEPGRCH